MGRVQVDFLPRDRRGFGYITAVLILGLLAFMGMFLAQSSQSEYSQAAMSCYATMAQQLAEAAADEAFLTIEKEFKNDPVKKAALLEQAQTSEIPTSGGSGGSTGLNPKLLDILKGYQNSANQVTGLMLTHMTKPGFEIEQILPAITDFRPIDHGWFAAEECIYRPKDRAQSFDTKMSRDFNLSLTFSVKISVRMGSKKHRFQFQITRDMKIVNVGPVARNYTLFSCIGIDPNKDSGQDVYNDLNRGQGRLVLWNQPFQSRLYICGPAVIGVENPDRYEVGNDDGRLISTGGTVWPGFNLAFQYDDTYSGLSYLPTKRCLWKNLGNATKQDYSDSRATADEKAKFKDTYVNMGFILRTGATAEVGWFSQFTTFLAKEYVRGTYKKQMFLPAGPFCRLPWRFVTSRIVGPYQPNTIGDKWPDPNKNLTIEHRFLREDSSYEKNTVIYVELLKHVLNMPTGSVKTYDEFALWYHNPSPLNVFFGNIGNFLTTGPRTLFHLGEGVVRSLFKFDNSVSNKPDFSKMRNFFPTNFKNFPKAAVSKFKSVDEIPKDENGIWVLDGLYWLDYFQTSGPVVFKGKGIIFVGDYIDSKPFTIGGSMLRYRDAAKMADPNYINDNHLTLVYYPVPSTGRIPTDPGYLDGCQMVISGTGAKIEASIFSLAGIKTDAGRLADSDYLALNMDPNKKTLDWSVNLDGVSKKVNMIYGNYVNYFFKKFRMDGDVWVVHDWKNPFYFDPKTKQIKEVYAEADELMAHTVHVSPKIQHLSFSGGGAPSGLE